MRKKYSWYLALAMATSFTLVGSLISPVQADTPDQPADAVTVEPPAWMLEPNLLPPMPSEVPAIPAAVTPTGDFEDIVDNSVESSSGLLVEGRLQRAGNAPTPKETSFNIETSTLQERSETSDTYLNADGTHTTFFGNEPLNALDDSGEWIPVTTRLERDATTGAWSTGANALRPSFAARADQEGAFSISRGGYAISFTLEGAGSSPISVPSAPRQQVNSNVATYADVFDGADIKYEVGAGSVKESILLAKPPEVSTWAWRIEANALDLSVDENNVVNFSDRYGEVQFQIPAPTMWDSSTPSPAYSDEIGVTVSPVDGGWYLQIVADDSWLSDPSRVYPVTVDPTVIGAGTYYAFTATDSYTAPTAVTGRHSTGSLWRSAVKYNYNTLAGKQVTYTSATATPTSSASGSTSVRVYLAQCLAFSCAGDQFGSFALTSGTTPTNLFTPEPVSIYAQWVAANYYDGAIFFTGEELPGAYQYREFTSTLVVDWKDYPSVTAIVAPSPADGELRAPVMPIFNVTGNDPSGAGMSFRYVVGTTADVQASKVYESPWSDFGANPRFQVPQGVLSPSQRYYWKAYVRDAYNGTLGVSTERSFATVRSFTTNTPAPTPSQPASAPSNGSTITTRTPTLSTSTVVDANGDPVQYQFRIATGSDGKTGAVISSGWLSSPTWSVPEGSLQNGGSYSWVALTSDGIDTDFEPSWRGQFKVDLRLGASGPSPFDNAGSALVNLANGNMSLQFSSPLVGTVGGPIGLAFSYNSQQSPGLSRGLRASYYDARTLGQVTTSTFDFADKSPLLVRTDPAISFQWGSDAAGPAVPHDYHMATWTGFIRVPTSGTYTFGTWRQGGARAWIDGVQVINQWTSLPSSKSWGASKVMSTSPVPFKFDYFNATGQAGVELWVRDPTGKEFIVPPDWFSTSIESLPAGWSASTAISGPSGSYVSAQVGEASVSLLDSTGTVHTYRSTSGGVGGYAPPEGEYGILSLDSAGHVVLTEQDGTVFSFNAQGRPALVTAPADAIKRALPIVTYRADTGQIDRISDPLSRNSGSDPVTYSREIRFAYEGDNAASVGLSPLDSDGTGSACPGIPDGEGGTWGTPPAGMLCRIIYPGHVAGAEDTTRLIYNGLSLTRIWDPGNEFTDFGYDNQKRITSWRDSLATDLILSAPDLYGQNSAQWTELQYDSLGRVATITMPAANGLIGSPQAKKTYTYGVGSTHVDVVGLTVPDGRHAATVTYDSAWRMLTSSDGTGLTTSRAWNERDFLLSATDAFGQMTTHIYDGQDRLTDTFGPAPITCFGSDRRPNGTCSTAPAHSQSWYDSGLLGLSATFYDNTGLVGAPKTFALGLTPGTPGIDKNWGAVGPGGGIIATDQWAVKLTGLITFPAAGTYTLTTNADDGTALWVDDIPVVNNWYPGPTRVAGTIRTLTVGEGETRRIRLQYADFSGSANLQLKWTMPSGVTQTVPGTALRPSYGLATQSTVFDSVPTNVAGVSDLQVPDLVTSTEYAHPWIGIATAVTLDPNGQALRTESTYEAPGSGWLRTQTKRLPSATAQNLPASIAGTTRSYWSDKEGLPAAVCGVPAGTPQYGYLMSTTGPTPASGSAVSTQFVYDLFGRTVGTKRTGDDTWTCTTYDARGRVSSVSYPAFGSTAARTVIHNYASGGNPLVNYVQDGSVAGSPNGSRITVVSDLLGRTTSATDVWNTVTSTTYDPVTGYTTGVTTTPPGGSSTTLSYTYDFAGNVELVKLNGVTLADPSYANHLPQSVAYSNGSRLASTGYDSIGRTNSVTWSFPDIGGPVAWPIEDVYSTGFEAGPDSWESAQSLTISTSNPRQGAAAALLSQTDSSTAVASRSVSGLVPGRSYSVSTWIASTRESPNSSDVRMGIDGIGSSPLVATQPAASAGVTWIPLSYSFTANATTQALSISAESGAAANASILIDSLVLTKDAWTAPALTQDSVTDQIVRSQSGRILTNTLDDGLASEVASYQYDSAARLVTAALPGRTLTYGFGSTTGCGLTTPAGNNNNRTSFRDENSASGLTTMTYYCYDHADRLTATSTSNNQVGANPVTASNLSSIQYDAHGNTIGLADQTITYDIADRHVRTTLENGTTIAYLLDAADRIVQRSVSGSPGGVGNGVIRYLQGGVTMTATAANAVLEQVVTLPGGVTYAKTVGGQERWAYPNLHGDYVLSADKDGMRTGSRVTYDPYGQPIDPSTGQMGTLAADDAGPDVLSGDLDFGWAGQNGLFTEHGGTIATIEMGARQYVPALGRFLEVDPIEGGVTNAYNYPGDPINQQDPTGTFAIPLIPLAIFALALIAALITTAVVVKPKPITLGPPPKTPSQLDVLLPAIQAVAVVAATANAAMSEAAAVIPAIPSVLALSYKKFSETTYHVYTIRTADNKVWKYGITRAQPYYARPESQLGKCPGVCTHNPAEDIEVTGWFGARFKEYSLIFDYWITHDFHCPPGQVKSCR